MEFRHYSVMLAETIEQLQIKPQGIYLDGTLGGGGHALEICKRLDGGQLFGTDQDDAAIAAASERLRDYQDQVTLIRCNFMAAADTLRAQGITQVDGIVLDLGVSSHQLDEGERGFSYRFDARLDMRMDRRSTLTAGMIVNSYSQQELARVLQDYGEEPFARNIAKHIVRVRQEQEIATTFELNEIIKAAIPAKKRQNGHPSKRVFQALRIECNRELEVLREAIQSLCDLLAPGGRFCIITFHSLEDRIVKTVFKNKENPCTCPPEFPVCVCNKQPEGRCVTRKPILPSAAELAENSRSKSAKLRVFEKRSG